MPHRKRASITKRSFALPKGTTSRLFRDICILIENARTRAAIAVNSELTLRNWMIGQRIRKEILHQKRAEYGKAIVATLSQQLSRHYGSGYTRDALFRMVQFTERFPHQNIVVTLSRQLSWSHIVELIPIEDQLKREYYIELCRIGRWSLRTLREKVQGMMYERSAISRKPAELARKELVALRDNDQMTPDLVFRDPYLLNFLGLKDTYSERDLEAAILHELERFILELGDDFAFVARQRRIVIDNEDYYVDLLFFHRRMRRLVAVDLKLGKFQAADKGQMELYLRWLERHERRPGEKKPVGLILCAGKSAEHVELLQLEKSGIRVAEYLTQLPSRRTLMRKLNAAIKTANTQLVHQPHKQ